VILKGARDSFHARAKVAGEIEQQTVSRMFNHDLIARLEKRGHREVFCH
jgi:hypothetical protein